MRLGPLVLSLLLLTAPVPRQAVTVGIVDFYGARRLQDDAIRDALAIPEGTLFESEDAARRAVDAARERIRALDASAACPRRRSRRPGIATTARGSSRLLSARGARPVKSP